MNKKEILEFPISIYGEAEQVNDVLTKVRCRVFYRNGNRNGTYITEDFANELISTLHYVPIKGIYNGQDYTDHGIVRSEGRIYGIVPVDNNFSWEMHLDEDGVAREYACTDVYLFTALYTEAKEIIGKSLSMELYEPSLKYHMAIIDGMKYAVFDHGSFLGLQVLGDNVEPCFEGASFFSLQQSIENTINKIKQYSELGGQSEMFKFNYKLSDNQKYEAIFALLNENFNEAGGWVIDYAIAQVFDEYAIAYKYETGEYERVYYTKDDEKNMVTLGDRVKVYMVDVTESELQTLETLKALNGGTYTAVNEVLEKAEENAADCENFSTKIEELNSAISTLESEVETFKTKLQTAEDQYTEAGKEIDSLTEENEALKTYKKNIETQSKEAVIAEYANKLSEDVLDAYKEKFEEYSVEELDMHLAYELKKVNASVFTQTPKSGFLPKEEHRSSVEQILSGYKR